MINKIILAALFLLSSELNAKISDWWEHPPAKTEPVPFSRYFVEPYCCRFFPDIPDHNARTTKYDFPIHICDGDFGMALRGEDEILGVRVSLELAHNSGHIPIHCKVKHGENTYYSSDIWMTRVNNKKSIYLISFKECDTNLVIYKSKDKQTATAQWALLRERPVIQEEN